LPNVGPYIYDVSISGFTRSSIYIHDISSLRVKPLVRSFQMIFKFQIATVKHVAKTTANHIQVYFIK